MIPDFETYCLNESSLRTIKKELHGAMNSKNRSVMRKLLKKHVVYFKFKKKNGELRRAVGTLISSYLPALRGGSPKPEHQMVYYDLEKEHWRSFRSFSFINILNIKSEDDYKGIKSKHKKELEKKDIHKEKEDEELIKKDEHVPKKHDEHDEKESEHVDKHDEKSSDKEIKKEDIKKKTFDVGDKIPEKELMRRSTDFRHGSKKNKFTKKSNDAHKKGDLDDEDEENED